GVPAGSVAALRRAGSATMFPGGGGHAFLGDGLIDGGDHGCVLAGGAAAPCVGRRRTGSGGAASPLIPYYRDPPRIVPRIPTRPGIFSLMRGILSAGAPGAPSDGSGPGRGSLRSGISER